MPIDNSELNIILDRINQWITNCDIKSSIILGLIGVILGTIITNGIIEKLIKICEIIISCNNLVNTIYLTLIIISILPLLTGIIYIILSLWARTNIVPEDELVTNSLIFYQTISSNFSFKEYSKKIKKINDDELSDEIISQIYINSTICTKKFKNYRNGLILSMIGLTLLLFLIFIGYIIY